MRLVRLGLEGLAALLVAATAAASPLTISDLTALVRSGIDEGAIVRLVEAEGLAAPLGAGDALVLREAGMSASLVSRLVTWTAGDGIEIEQRDGVLVVSGSGVPADASGSEGDASWRDEPGADPGEATPPEWPAESAAPPQDDDNGYPTGAVFGWSGGAVFLPARFGGSRPSAFGRTIVMTGELAPWMGAPWLPPAAPVMPSPDSGWITIRTSRGEIRVPN